MIRRMVLRENNGLQYYQAPLFTETNLVQHAFSTRIGGISKKPFDSLNLAYHTGDDPQKVQTNRQLFVRALGISLEDTVSLNQVHGLEILTASEKDKGKGALEINSALGMADGLMTKDRGVALLAFFADCVPLMFLDPFEKAIAISHAGWKGTVGEIGAKTVQKMAEEYNSKPENLLVIIGPSIGACHYEVDQKVVEAFQRKDDDWARYLMLKDDNKAQLNLWEANRLQLLKSGISEEKIVISSICTYCRADLLYSYRFSGGNTGRLAALIMLL